MDKNKEVLGFISEEGISNGERPLENITKEEVFLMLYRYSLDFLEENWNLNTDFIEKNSNNESDWARECYLFIVSEGIDDGKEPKKDILKENLANILFNFFKEYHQFKEEKNAKDWCEKNGIIKIDNEENISRMDFWKILLVCTEILEG